MTTSDEHRRLRELLGSYALDDLPPRDAAALRAHLDGCAACRSELADIAPLADALRGVDPDALTATIAPPPDLGDRIRSAIAAERAAAPARRRRRHPTQTWTLDRRLVAAAAAVALLATGAGLGTAASRLTAPAITATPPAAPLPVEQIRMTAADGLQADSAAIIAHTWGVEARFEAAGFEDGQVYRAAFRALDGRLLPAGEFLGTGENSLKCNMQAALLRQDTAGFVVQDTTGRTVLSADLPA